MNNHKLLPPAFPWAYFAMAYGIAWLVWLPGVAASLGFLTLPLPASALVTLGAFGPLAAAFFQTAREQGRVGVKQLWQQALNFKVDPRWLAVTLLLPLSLAGAAYFIYRLTYGTAAPLPLFANPLLIVATFVFIFFLGGPVQEEFGWRGYALVRLQRRWSAFTASLIVGAAWGLWHLPLFFMSGVSQSYLPFLGVHGLDDCPERPADLVIQRHTRQFAGGIALSYHGESRAGHISTHRHRNR
jgi:membrane protease YdiL (CAAX protease family)